MIDHYWDIEIGTALAGQDFCPMMMEPHHEPHKVCKVYVTMTDMLTYMRQNNCWDIGIGTAPARATTFAPS